MYTVDGMLSRVSFIRRKNLKRNNVEMNFDLTMSVNK